MANSKIEKYREDILTAINNIEASTIGLEAKHFNNYEISWIVECGIEIIAEALKRILVENPAIRISNYQKIIGTRNKITHEYDVVDNYMLFLIVNKYLPIPRSEIEQINSAQ